MNGRVHHYMKIASSTSQNCGISYFIFDDIASLAGSADARNVDPDILKDICNGLKDENPYCTDLRFIGVEARARAEGQQDPALPSSRPTTTKTTAAEEEEDAPRAVTRLR